MENRSSDIFGIFLCFARIGSLFASWNVLSIENDTAKQNHSANSGKLRPRDILIDPTSRPPSPGRPTSSYRLAERVACFYLFVPAVIIEFR